MKRVWKIGAKIKTYKPLGLCAVVWQEKASGIISSLFLYPNMQLFFYTCLTNLKVRQAFLFSQKSYCEKHKPTASQINQSSAACGYGYKLFQQTYHLFVVKLKDRCVDKMNELIREDYLYEFILSFQYEWDKILREDGGRIRSRTAYMKSCLWDWLKRWKIEEYNLLASLK